jgi:MYXO-CTERM domain-containing protein
LAANAAVVTVADPGGSTEMGARLRWGRSGFEAALRDGGTSVVNLNPVGTPVWVVGSDYKFNVSYVVATGTLSLGVDFNGDTTFGAGETLSLSTFAAPGLTNYSGYGFNYLQISGNEGGSSARSSVSSLVINGESESSLAPVGTFLDTFYDDNALGAIGWNINGVLNFSTVGTGDERPSWNFSFRSPELLATNDVPEPGSLTLAALGLLGLVAARRRKTA